MISGLDPDAGDMWEDEFAYSATSTTLTVISLQPFHDSARGVIAGSYTVVDDFALVGSERVPVRADVPCEAPARRATGAPAKDKSAGTTRRADPSPPWARAHTICTNGYWAYEDYVYSCPNEPAL